MLPVLLVHPGGLFWQVLPITWRCSVSRPPAPRHYGLLRSCFPWLILR